MPKFVYRAKKGPGDPLEGEIVAATQADALRRIEAMGCIPVWVREKGAVAAQSVRVRIGRIPSRDVNIFTRQLASLQRAGVPILRSLSTVAQQTDHPGLKRIIEDIEQTVRDGRMLSEALLKYPTVFPDLYISMIRSGESGGVLDQMLLRLAEAREREEEIVSKVRAALAYPALVFAVGVATVFVMLVFFLPKIAELFTRSQQVLPLPTRLLISVSRAISRAWYWGVLAGVLLWLLSRRVRAGMGGRSWWDRAMLHLPLFGSFIREADLARFARTLSLLVRTDIAIDRALSLSASTLRNSVLREDLEQVRRNTVQRGMPLASGLRRTRSFPPFVSNMVAVGEESGQLEDVLGEIAAFYERQLDQRIKIVTSLLEPALILIVGAVVGFIILAMLLPIFQVGGALR